MTIPAGSIPRNTSLPGGNWTLAIDDLEDGKAGNGKRMLKATLRATAPVAGMMHFENFVVGSESDPLAQDPQTWIGSFAATRLMQMLDKAGVALSDEVEVEEMCEAARGHEFDAIAVQEVDDGKRDPKYKGNVRTKLTAFYEAGVLDKGGGPAAPATALAAPQAQRPAARPAAPTAPQRPAAPARPAAPVRQAALPVADDGAGEYEAPDVPPPTHAPPAPPAQRGAPPARPIPRRA